LLLRKFTASVGRSVRAYPIRRVGQNQIDGRQQRQNFAAVSKDQPAFTNGHFFKHSHSYLPFAC
jgi:hypothetical protein